MKRLTAAYESRDLHSMLAIEMEWLGSESKDLQAASDEKLKSYIELLREQTREVEREVHFLRFEDPLFQFAFASGGHPMDASALASHLRKDAERLSREAEILGNGGKAAKSLVHKVLHPRHRYPNY